MKTPTKMPKVNMEDVLERAATDPIIASCFDSYGDHSSTEELLITTILELSAERERLCKELERHRIKSGFCMTIPDGESTYDFAMRRSAEIKAGKP
jgi:hypothetical protein